MRYVPASLSKGDTIAITCPSGYMAIEQIQNAINTFEDWGLTVRVGETLGYPSDNYFSAPDELKIKELQSFLDDTSVKAIFMGRGGYGMSRIIDALDWTSMLNHPKWICGFSDITLLHTHLNAQGIVSLHSPMCSTFNLEDEEIKSTNLKYLYQSLMTNDVNEYEYEHTPDYYRAGQAEGRLLGGNLAMLSHAVGSNSFPDFTDSILFIEDIGEHIYKIDRMLYQLKRAGVFKHIKAVIIGYFSDVEDTVRPFGASWEEVVFAHFKDLNIPLAFGFPSGHEDLNVALKLGQVHSIDINYKRVKLKEGVINVKI